MTCSAYIDDYKKIVAFWTPKCACTPVDHWFAKGVLTQNPIYANSMESKLAEFDHIEEALPRLFLATNGFKYKFSDAIHFANNNEYFVVHFTRHPALRLVSAFLNKFVVYGSQYLESYESLEPFAKHAVKEIYLQNGWQLEKYRGIRFSDLVNYLYATKKLPDRYIDHHWDAQLPSGIIRDEDLKPDFIVYVERFNDDLKVLYNHLGIDFMPGKFNVSKFDNAQESTDNLTHEFSMDLIRSRILLRPGNLIDWAMAEMIGAIYNTDYMYFGYSPENVIPPPLSGVVITGNPT